MSMTLSLSVSAVAVLRFEIKGYRAKDPSRRLPAYRELAAAGLMEAVSDSKYRFTAWGMEHREAILDRESDRIERERYAPPDRDLSDAAMELLSRIVAGRVTVDEANRPLFRELAAARVVTFGGSFAGGPESAYRFTYWGWRLKDELLGYTRDVV